MTNNITRKQYDCIIVGAGPAGCSAAYSLAMQGHEVLLADKAKFPRDKVCGDCLGPASLEYMDRIGILKDIEAGNPWKTDHVIINSPNGYISKSKIPKVNGFRDYNYVFPRIDLDAIFLKYIKTIHNITAVENFMVIDLLYEQGKVCGVTGKFKNQILNINGRYIIGADGVNSIIAKRLNLINKDNDHRCFSIRAYFDNVTNIDSAIELYFDKLILPGYAWIFPVSETKANIGIGMDMRALKKSDEKLKNLFEMFIESNKAVKEKLRNAAIIEKSLKGCFLATRSYPGPRHKDNVLLIGDAGSMIHPLTGEGISSALRTGECAANAIGISLTGKSFKSTGKTYQKMWKENIKWYDFKIIKRSAFYLTKKFLADFIVCKAAKNPETADLIIAKALHLKVKK